MCRRMACNRMAEGRSGTNQVLALDPAGRNKIKGLGGARQTALDYRTGLSGTEAGTRPRPLRRAGLAGLSPSCHALHCRLRLLAGGAKPFFPLRARRPTGVMRPAGSSRLPTPRLAACGPSGIIPHPFPPFASALRACSSGNSLVALSAALSVYNTVVLIPSINTVG